MGSIESNRLNRIFANKGNCEKKVWGTSLLPRAVSLKKSVWNQRFNSRALKVKRQNSPFSDLEYYYSQHYWQDKTALIVEKYKQ